MASNVVSSSYWDDTLSADDVIINSFVDIPPSKDSLLSSWTLGTQVAFLGHN